jgi:hypothetical protein
MSESVARAMTREEKEAATGIGKPILEALDVCVAEASGLPERLTLADRALLLRTWDVPIDVEDVDADLHQVLWMMHYKLLAIWVDSADRVWIRATALGREIVRPSPKRRRRR